MASPTQVPELPGEEIALIFQINDADFNQCIVFGMMHGIYTCVFLQTVWIVCVSRREKYQNKIGRKIMLAIIVALYFLGTIEVAVNWAFTRYSFITHGENFWTIYSTFVNASMVKHKPSTLFMVESVATSIAGGLQNILADTAVIWRCWTVWGFRWSIVLLPILCTIGGTTTKIFQEVIEINALLLNVQGPEDYKPSAVDWTMVYISLSLAVTLMCTILIVFRIVTVGRANRQTTLGGYRAVIEIVVESAALLSFILVVYMVTYVRGTYAAIYVDAIAASIRGIAPTLLVGRVASGHSRPDDAWKGSVLSSLHFGTRNYAQTQASTQYSDQRDTASRLQDGNVDANEPLEESKPATEEV